MRVLNFEYPLYLRTTSSLGITYHREAARGGTLEGFVDSDWASDADGRRSIGGYVFLLAGGRCLVEVPGVAVCGGEHCGGGVYGGQYCCFALGLAQTHSHGV